MKKISVLFGLCLLLLFACHQKAVPVIADRTEHPPAPNSEVTSYTPEMIEAGKEIYTVGKCTKCHSPKPVEHWTVYGWKAILKSMIPKAKLDSIQKIQVTAYVNSNAKKL